MRSKIYVAKLLNAAQRQMVAAAAIRPAFTQETVALGEKAQPSGQVRSCGLDAHNGPRQVPNDPARLRLPLSGYSIYDC